MGSGNLAHKTSSSVIDAHLLEVFHDVGQTLAEARQEQGLTIPQVAAKIHIRQRYLTDLEEGHLADLPGRVYIFGFIRTYARFLKLDGEELIRRLTALPQLPDYERSQVPIPIYSEEEPTFPILMISAVLVLAVILGSYFFLKPASQPVLPPEPQLVKEEAPQEATEPTKPVVLEETKPIESLRDLSSSVPELPSLPSLPKVSNIPQKITLKALEPSWVEIRNRDGQVLFLKVLQPGEDYTLPVTPGITLNTGNAGGLEISVGNQKLPLLGKHGEVKRGIRPEDLKP